MKYVVTELGPLDWLPPGTDVTGRYDPKTIKELLKYKVIAKVADASDTEQAEEVDDAADKG